MSPETKQYREVAEAQFELLMSKLEEADKYKQRGQLTWKDKLDDKVLDFWKLGNTFDTMIDFLEIIDQGQADKVANRVIEQYDTFKGDKKDNKEAFDDAWFDDFGWWVVAAKRAAGKSFFAQHKTKFETISSECWDRFKDNAPNVWNYRPVDKDKNVDKYKDHEPAVPDGVWNSYWTGTNNKEHRGPQATPDPLPARQPPEKQTLNGIQNTVTNAIHLISAQRMADKRAEAEFNFLDNWRTKGLWWYPNPTNKDAALVRERVSHFKNGQLAPGFQQSWAWSGDQGLIIAGLVGAQEPGFKDRVSELLKGAHLFLVDKDNLMVPYSSASKNPTGKVPQNDTEDYDTGTGVFWRNVLYAWNNNVQDLLRNLYLPWVKQNANAVKRGEPEDGELVRKITTLTNQIAVLVAAVKMN